MLKAFGMHSLISKQSDDEAFEYIENPMKTTDMMSRIMMTCRKYKK